MRNKIIFAAALVCILVSSPVYAHHSFSATFTEEKIVVEGVVDSVKFSNPHVIVYFNVSDEQGEQTLWMTEGGSATGLRRSGWEQDSLKPGDYIRVTGNSSRNGSPMLSTGVIVLLDPQTGKLIGSPGGSSVPELAKQTIAPLELADGRPNLSGSWIKVAGVSRAAERRSADGGRQREAGGRPGHSNNKPPFNKAGAALQATFDPKDDPQVKCELPGLVRQAATTPHPVQIAQYDDHVVIAYEEYGGVRKIYFDDRDLVGGEKTKLGQSIARYEGQKLVVETSNLVGALTGPHGNILTDQMTTVESFYRHEDESGQSFLAMDMQVSDPGHLTATWTVSWKKAYLSDYDFIGVDCQVPY